MIAPVVYGRIHTEKVKNNNSHYSYHVLEHSSKMIEKPAHKKVNSHVTRNFDLLKFNKENADKAGEKAEESDDTNNNLNFAKKNFTPTKEQIRHAKKVSEAEFEQKKKDLSEYLDAGKYKEIEMELEVIHQIQAIQNNFQNEQTCKILFLRYKTIEFSISLFCIVGKIVNDLSNRFGNSIP
jgi:hypothetical protein